MRLAGISKDVVEMVFVLVKNRSSSREVGVGMVVCCQ